MPSVGSSPYNMPQIFEGVIGVNWIDNSFDLLMADSYSANTDVIIREKKDVLVLPERLVSFEDGGKKALVELPQADPKADPKKVEIKFKRQAAGRSVEFVAKRSPGRRP